MFYAAKGVSLSGVPLWVGQPEANNVLRNWSPEEHKYQPARLKAAAKRLLLAAACNPRSASLERHPGDSFISFFRFNFHVL